MIKAGDRVLVDMPNRYLREKIYWQPFEVKRVIPRATGTIVKLKGLIVPSIEITGDAIESLRLFKEVSNDRLCRTFRSYDREL